jgi:hypothetical protein
VAGRALPFSLYINSGTIEQGAIARIEALRPQNRHGGRAPGHMSHLEYNQLTRCEARHFHTNVMDQRLSHDRTACAVSQTFVPGSMNNIAQRRVTTSSVVPRIDGHLAGNRQINRL